MSSLNVNINKVPKFSLEEKKPKLLVSSVLAALEEGSGYKHLHMQNEKEDFFSLNSRSFKIVIKSTKHQQS